MAPTLWRCCATPPATSIASSKARSRPICRSRRRPISSWWSTPRRPWRSASNFPPPYSRGLKTRRSKSQRRAGRSALFADAHALQPRQHLIAEQRQLAEPIDHREADAAPAAAAQMANPRGDRVGRAHERIAADRARGEILALLFVFLGADGRRRDVLDL